MVDHNNYVRATDPDTSLAAAIKAAKASANAARAVWQVMSEGKELIDEEIWVECRKNGYISSLSTVQHGRLALSNCGYVLDTGKRRKTSDGCLSIVWVISVQPDIQMPKILTDPNPPESPRRALKRKSLRLAPSPENAERWRAALRGLYAQAVKNGIKIDPSIDELGKWLKDHCNDG